MKEELFPGFELIENLREDWSGSFSSARRKQTDHEYILHSVPDHYDVKQEWIDALRASSHENILLPTEILDQEGTNCLVYDRWNAAWLDDWLNDRSISWKQKLKLLKALAESLDHAHGLNLVHGDLNPSRILVDRSGRVQLTGFGLLPKWHTWSETSRPGLSYLAPEQIVGRQPDIRADVYGLGAVACQMMTGQPPFVSSGAKRIYQPLFGEPRVEVASLIRALAKDPAERPVSCGTLVEELAGEGPGAASKRRGRFRGGAAGRQKREETLGEPSEPPPPPQPPTPTQGAPQPALFFHLEGKLVKGDIVQCGSDVDLIFDQGELPPEYLAQVRGKELDKAVRHDNDLEIAVTPRGFSFRDSKWFQVATFENEKLKEPLRFQLKADSPQRRDAGFHVVFSVNGCILYDPFIEIRLVDNVNHFAKTYPPSGAFDFDLDDLVKAREREPRDVRLVFQQDGGVMSIKAHGIPNAPPTLHVEGLGEAGWGNLLLENNEKVARIVNKEVWNRLRDQLDRPDDADDAYEVGESLRKFVEIGSSFYEALGKADENLAWLLRRIDELPEHSKITIQSNRGLLPLEIVYPDSYNAEWEHVKPQPQRLWGYRFQFEYLPLTDNGVKGPTEARQPGDLFLSLNLNPKIDDELEEAPFRPVQSHKGFAERLLGKARNGVFT